MTLPPSAHSDPPQDQAPHREGRDAILPLSFDRAGRSGGAAAYVSDPSAQKLLEFFETKGLAALKDEDRREQWYDDWLAFQAHHGIYAAALSPAAYSARGGSFDLLKYTRLLELFAYCSPAHGYSLQVTFLGLFSILMGSNELLKREAVAALEAGKLLAFGISEKDHGSDLMANAFTITANGSDHFAADGSKYYIGNAATASIISILGRKQTADETRTDGRTGGAGRAPFMLIALRPQQAPGFQDARKIHTLGVRAADVGAFDVVDHVLPQGDVIAEGRAAWDAVFGTVTLGKFFLGFGSIGICEHAMHEALTHLRTRTLYGKPVIAMPHIRALAAQACARLIGMKLYAYRALDYVHAASAADRRYLLFCAVQKARVSTEAVKVMALLSECIGAKGFETDTYFEMALRDVQLIPGLEGSMHINFGLAAQFLPRYFDRFDCALPDPPSLVAGSPSVENSYLMQARTGATHAISFRPFLDAYHAHAAIPNVALFARQAAAFRRVALSEAIQRADKSDTRVSMAVGQCLATIAYGQLVAENAARLQVPRDVVSAIFGLLVADFNVLALQTAALPIMDGTGRQAMADLVRVPRTAEGDWDAVLDAQSGAR